MTILYLESNQRKVMEIGMFSFTGSIFAKPLDLLSAYTSGYV